jgi:hypothetical protein
MRMSCTRGHSLCVSARMLDPVARSPSDGLEVHSAGLHDLAHIDCVRRGRTCGARRMAGPGCARVVRYSGSTSLSARRLDGTARAAADSVDRRGAGHRVGATVCAMPTCARA